MKFGFGPFFFLLLGEEKKEGVGHFGEVWLIRRLDEVDDDDSICTVSMLQWFPQNEENMLGK